jgi:transcriptional regulator with XRE-family HTH domain
MEEDPEAGSMFEALGRALVALRRQRGLKQARVARSAGMGKSQLGEYEAGKKLPKLDSLANILEALQVNYLTLSLFLLLEEGRQLAPEGIAGDLDAAFDRLMSSFLELYKTFLREGL